eukprot:CAMPEP_0206283832 /NCGR_PEP_ID=MMETSP0047_2-20121206/40443_1 /ASSEMBLY_ACC=CAM_ASM_000192 /TAXON_ID=195065 /ORGANISM="Chroomonas mesostigmatica_cf, Strain CCMP1168" /LENGTH=326 /DNA_ID=CAMNT_0053714229 /DNA_START=52 /DNA_END=1032 /DNA_ORIENTATION=-
MSVPAFTLDKPRYDQSTWMGRTMHFFAVTNPAYLFTSEKQMQDDRDKLEAFKKGKRAASTSDAELWQARTRLDAIMHPDTGKPVSPFFRVCAFVPANIPICAGMLLTPPTTFNVVLWQWVNQSYNAGFNFANRNASSPITNTDLGTAYVSACSASIAIGLGLPKAAERATFLSPSIRVQLMRASPFVAVSIANVFNLLAMRSNELKTGIPVSDGDGKELGKSKLAAQSAISQAAVTRAVLPAPVLLLPPLGMRLVDAVFPAVKTSKLAPVANLAVIVASVWGALPFAIGLFPQECSMPVSKLEKEFQGLRDKAGKEVVNVTFNKGV